MKFEKLLPKLKLYSTEIDIHTSTNFNRATEIEFIVSKKYHKRAEKLYKKTNLFDSIKYITPNKTRLYMNTGIIVAFHVGDMNSKDVEMRITLSTYITKTAYEKFVKQINNPNFMVGYNYLRHLVGYDSTKTIKIQ